MQPTLNIRRIQKGKIYKDIVDQIKRSILKEEISEGNRLPTERELAQRFGVSRVSVRQALTVLHEMGLVESRPGGGTFVRNGIKESVLIPLSGALLTEKELLEEPLEVRRIVEPEVARLAAMRATAKDVKELERIISLQESKARKRAPITAEDTLFHQTIVKLTKNGILVKLVQVLHHHLEASRHQSLIAPGGNERSIDDHKRILAAISRKDPRGAYQAMVHHLTHVEELVAKRLRKRP